MSHKVQFTNLIFCNLIVAMSLKSTLEACLMQNVLFGYLAGSVFYTQKLK